MNARLLTIIRRARLAIEKALLIVGWGDMVARDALRRAHHWCIRARKALEWSAVELAKSLMGNAAVHLQLALSRMEVL